MSSTSQLLVGGDDVNAIVVDYGSHSFRYGHAGEEAPTLVIPTTVGWIEQVVSATEEKEERGDGDDRPEKRKTRGIKVLSDAKLNGNASAGDTNHEATGDIPELKKQKICYVDTSCLSSPKEGLEMDSTVIVDGMIENWEAFQAMLEYAVEQHRPVEPSQHPFLFSEPQWITKAKREQLCEIIFEKFNASAFFTVKSPVLTCFAHGKSTGLVLDSGRIHTTAVAVHEGFCLSGTAVRSPLGGDFITNECKKELERLKIDLVPQYMVKSKESVEAEQPPKWTKKQNLPKYSPSFHEWKVKELLNDFKQVLAVSDTSLNEVNPDALDPKEYEFPTGYRKTFTKERYQIPEYLFDPSLIRSGNVHPNSSMGMSNMIHNCLSISDQDIRPQLWGNILITGGNSCIPGFVERVSADCTRRSTSSMKLKCAISSGSGPERNSERLFAPWTGGSILGSMGTFQNMWVSRSEYEETGRSIVGKKCP